MCIKWANIYLRDSWDFVSDIVPLCTRRPDIVTDRDLENWDLRDKEQTDARRRVMWELVTLEGWMVQIYCAINTLSILMPTFMDAESWFRKTRCHKTIRSAL